jgi:hypothetical protein
MFLPTIRAGSMILNPSWKPGIDFLNRALAYEQRFGEDMYLEVRAGKSVPTQRAFTLKNSTHQGISTTELVEPNEFAVCLLAAGSAIHSPSTTNLYSYRPGGRVSRFSQRQLPSRRIIRTDVADHPLKSPLTKTPSACGLSRVKWTSTDLVWGLHPWLAFSRLWLCLDMLFLSTELHRGSSARGLMFIGLRLGTHFDIGVISQKCAPLKDGADSVSGNFQLAIHRSLRSLRFCMHNHCLVVIWHRTSCSGRKKLFPII